MGAGEFFKEGGEFKFGVEGAEVGGVGVGGGHGFEGVLDRQGAVDGDEVFAEQDSVAVVLEGFALAFAFDGVGLVASGVEGGFYRAELLDEFDGAFVADAGSAGDVVDAVAAEGHDVDDLLGADAQGGFDAGWVEDQVVLGGVEDADVLVDELHHVLVGGDDVDVVSLLGEAAGEGADDVVGFVAGEVEDGNVEGFEGAADVGLLLGEVWRSFGAGGLVAGVVDLFKLLGLDVELLDGLHLGRFFVAVHGGSALVDGGEVVRLEVLPQLVDHIDEDVGGGGGNAGARGHGARALHGVVGAEDEGHAVEEIDGWLLLGGGGGRHPRKNTAGVVCGGKQSGGLEVRSFSGSCYVRCSTHAKSGRAYTSN